jgi:hypothetical protein
MSSFFIFISLCLFFIILILLQIVENSQFIESYSNNEYKDYDLNNPQNALILAQQNAGNISVLKQRLDEMLGMNKQIQDLSNNYISLQDQVNGLVSAQQQYASQITGGQVPVITGATNNISNSITS